MPISGIQRYSRVLKQIILDRMLKSLVARSQAAYTALYEDINKFEQELAIDRDLHKDRLHRERSESRAIQIHNTTVITDWMGRFDVIHKKVRKYLEQVDERRQPHMRVWEMTVATQGETNSQGQRRLTVPLPEIKHKVLGHIQDLRVIVLQSTELFHFIEALQTHAADSKKNSSFLGSIRTRCESARIAAAKYKIECDERQYPGLAVEFLLKTFELVQLQIRTVVGDGKFFSKLREEERKILTECQTYIDKFPSCSKYTETLQRAQSALNIGAFFQPVTAEEQRQILEAMQREFRGTGHWYYCPNGHPVEASARKMC